MCRGWDQREALRNLGYRTRIQSTLAVYAVVVVGEAVVAVDVCDRHWNLVTVKERGKDYCLGQHQKQSCQAAGGHSWMYQDANCLLQVLEPDKNQVLRRL